MKGVVVDKVGGAFTVTDNLKKPSPGPNQILVKSLVTGINPVEASMQGTGTLVTSWPIVLGCDASGAVVSTGSSVTKFKKGDHAFGCTRLGTPGYSTFQEYFLMDEDLAFKRPAKITTEQAATIGVGLLSAGLGLISGCDIKLEKRGVDEDSKWAVILGAAGAVGQYGVQLAKYCGYKVVGSCSASSDKLVKSLGADATFSYKMSVEEQVKAIRKITGGKFSRVFDASAKGIDVGLGALEAHTDGDEKGKWLSSTNDWTTVDTKGVTVHGVSLGEIGREGNERTKGINADIAAFIPKFEKILGNGEIKPMEYEVVGETGVEGVLQGLDVFNAGNTGGKKIVVRIAAE